MDFSERKMPWWLIVMTGVVIIAASIFVLVERTAGLKLLTFLVALGALVYGVYNFVIALKNKDDNSMCISHLVHGLIDIVLFLLIIVIRNTPNLLGIVIACWLIVFGVFEIITARHSENNKRSRIGAILLLIGLIVLIVPLVFSIDYVILIAIVGLCFGLLRTIQGILFKIKNGESNSGLR